MTYDKEFLKQVLSVPTKTYKEDMMIDFITDWLRKENIPFIVDDHYNVYATKQTGEVDSEFYFPCLVSHTDTVHNIDTINVFEEQKPNAQGELKLSLKAYNDENKPTGIGGDDKAGIFACLTLLKKLPNVKAAFFVSEETGCHGSKYADKRFFENVGYAIQFDSPENWMVSEYLMGIPLFERTSEFGKTCMEILTESLPSNHSYMRHPYTDVFALKTLFDFSCINIPIGYYQYHTKNEYVVVEDVFNGIKIAENMIERLGNNLHYLKSNQGRQILV